MTDYKATSEDLTAVADAIRTAGDTSAQLEFPTGFVSAIGNLGGGGSSPWTHLVHEEHEVSTTSTTAGNVCTIHLGQAALTTSKLVYVRVRDVAGPRAGYFVGSDVFLTNPDGLNISANEIMGANVRMTENGTFQVQSGNGSGLYGVFGYTMNTAGTLIIRRRYHATNSLTIDGTYSVDVFTLDFPDGYPLPFES